MARNITNTKTLLMLQPFKVENIGIGRCMSKLARQKGKFGNSEKISETVVANEGRQPPEERGICWMPDPRTGIYSPIGQEWVMDGVPSDAASLSCTFWLRNIEGVDDYKSDDNVV
ncbi:late embryogenesis abundant protein [Striga asiatica]|uniref:Late embryogenesis abundant protein n=1 Tax=Striga asiatica TaxID=4170 RepID=A0A5A7R190_STRAF|nr:late embryogenesis abundant protein [Striga asiatica]